MKPDERLSYYRYKETEKIKSNPVTSKQKKNFVKFCIALIFAFTLPFLGYFLDWLAKVFS